MDISLPYGRGRKKLRIPPGIQIDTIEPAKLAPIEDVEDAFRSACGKPVAARPLAESLSPQSTVVVLVSDLTRGRGTEALLPLCVGYLTDHGVAPRSITVLVARGTHRKLAKKERAMLRAAVGPGVRIDEHDCDKTENVSALLLTRRGTPVRTNVALKDSDVTVLLAPVSFHYFAGFSGGRKLVLPGCADRASIEANHRLSLVNAKPVTLHPRCRAGRLDGNPVHEDMCETVEALHGIFGINFFCNEAGEIAFVNAGDPSQSHRRACDAYKKSHLCGITKPYDVLILSAGGDPYDINLVQSHKALRHAAGALKRGGSILYFAACDEGVGSKYLEAALRVPHDRFLDTAYEQYQLNNQTAVSLHDLTANFEIGMVSAMNVDILLSCGIKLCVNAEAFLAEALEKRAAGRAAVITRGASLLAVPEGED